MDMADDVVSAVIQLFSPNETEATWHGGCLTIGELSRRGLLLPTRLNEVFPIIHKALHFDLNQGNYSVGANVRDSACYIAWAFARVNLN
jgi:tubulin-specific chaperone D